VTCRVESLGVTAFIRQ